MGFRVWGLGFGVWGVRLVSPPQSRVRVLGQGLECQVLGHRFGSEGRLTLGIEGSYYGCLWKRGMRPLSHSKPFPQWVRFAALASLRKASRTYRPPGSNRRFRKTSYQRRPPPRRRLVRRRCPLCDGELRVAGEGEALAQVLQTRKAPST